MGLLGFAINIIFVFEVTALIILLTLAFNPISGAIIGFALLANVIIRYSKNACYEYITSSPGSK